MAQFNAEIYREAAKENLAVATVLYENENYPAAFYTAGVAVECIFRAYRFRRNPVFDSRHDLYALAREAQFFDGFSEKLLQEMSGALTDAAARWSNSHRYRSEKAMRTFLNDVGLYQIQGKQTVRGDVLAYNCRIIVEAATQIVTVGERRWNQ